MQTHPRGLVPASPEASPTTARKDRGNVKVSVVVVTHNHAPFIDQALSSVYEQDTDFDIEVIISEDASTDGTRAIVQGWHDRHPGQTRLILSEHNVRSNQVVARGFAAARGEYVALLDGDDYWTSRNKLRRQVACLDGDPSLTLCFHNAEVAGEGEAPFDGVWTSPNLKRRLSLADLWDGNPFATCTSLFRRAAVAEIPSWYDDFFPMTDWPLYVLFAEQGDIAFLPDVMGAYRLHPGGLFSPQSRAEKHAMLDGFYRRINACLGGRHERAIRSGHRRFFLDWTRAHLQTGEFELARACLGHARSFGGASRAGEHVEAMLLAARLKLAEAARAK